VREINCYAWDRKASIYIYNTYSRLVVSIPYILHLTIRRVG
jgi:hypothetical protein